MKKISMAVATCLLYMTVSAQVKLPAASPTEFIRQDFGLGTIELTYSRPSLKGRQMIGVVEPWGNVWRTGANAATKIHFTEEVEIGGKKIDSGSYSLYTIPQKNGEWSFILNKNVGNWGAFDYSASSEALRIPVKAGKNAQKVETLTMQFSDVMPESLNLNIKWEDFALKIPIKTDVKEKIRTSIETAMKGDKKPYWQAATFYYEYDKNYKKALEMVDAAFASQPNPPYYQLFYKARIQKDAGMKKAALETAQKALAAATDAKNDNYRIMSEQMISSLK